MSGGRVSRDDRRLLGDLLVEAGIATRRAVALGLEEQRLRGGRLGFNLLKLGLATPAALHLFLADHMDILVPDLQEGLRSGPPIDLIPGRLAHHYGMVPLRVEDGILVLGLASADNAALIPATEEMTGLAVDPLICPPSLLAEALGRFYAPEAERGVIYRAGGDHHLIVSDRRRRILPSLPETLGPDAPAGERLRSIAAEAVRRHARQIAIEPGPQALRVTFNGRGAEGQELPQPRGAYPGLALLLEGVSGMSSRGRIVPRQGRFVALIEGRRVCVSVSAIPGFEGDVYRLDLREERIAVPTREEIAGDCPALARIVDRLADEKRGLLVVAGSDTTDVAAGVSCILTLLDDRCPRRVAVGGVARHDSLRSVDAPHDEQEIAFEPILEGALAEGPDLLVLPDLLTARGIAAVAEQAARRFTIAAVEPAIDACAAAESIARRGVATRVQPFLGGILGVRLMERLCDVCRRPVDLGDLLTPAPRHRRPPAGSYCVAPGCSSCRGSGLLRLTPVCDAVDGGRILPMASAQGGAAALRRDSAAWGERTLFLAGLDKAAQGLVDVREPIRLLLHEC